VKRIEEGTEIKEFRQDPTLKNYADVAGGASGLASGAVALFYSGKWMTPV
jgi:hypothetical protein